MSAGDKFRAIESFSSRNLPEKGGVCGQRLCVASNTVGVQLEVVWGARKEAKLLLT